MFLSPHLSKMTCLPHSNLPSHRANSALCRIHQQFITKLFHCANKRFILKRLKKSLLPSGRSWPRRNAKLGKLKSKIALMRKRKLSWIASRSVGCLELRSIRPRSRRRLRIFHSRNWESSWTLVNAKTLCLRPFFGYPAASSLKTSIGSLSTWRSMTGGRENFI